MIAIETQRMVDKLALIDTFVNSALPPHAPLSAQERGGLDILRTSFTELMSTMMWENQDFTALQKFLTHGVDVLPIQDREEHVFSILDNSSLLKQIAVTGRGDDRREAIVLAVLTRQLRSLIVYGTPHDRHFVILETGFPFF